MEHTHAEPDQVVGSRMADEDRHGFVSAFVEGIRPAARRSRWSGRHVVLWGVVAAVALAAGALAVGAMAGGPSTASAAPLGAKTTASASATHVGAPASSPGGSPAGSTGGSGGGSGTGTSGSNNGDTAGSAANNSAGASSAAKPNANNNSGNSDNTGRRSAAATYSAVAGLDCSGDSTATYSDSEGYFTSGKSGWLRTGTGGYAGSGCTGGYESIPMSGTAGVANYNKTDFALYWWNFSSTFTSASCSFSIYVPNNPDQEYVGGDPTYYYFWNQNYQFGMDMTPTGDFGVSEIGNLGQWVSESSFTVTTGHVTLKIVDAGVDFDSAGRPDYHHHAAAPVRLSCTATS
jgi:hypothetical protein